MKRLALLLLLAACTPHVPSARYLAEPLHPVALAPARLAGTWHEIAAFPVPFQAGCTHTTATYGLRQDGSLSVLNRCRRGGAVSQIAGVATPVGPGQLSVRLEGAPLAGDLIVLGTLRGGRVVVLGTSSRTAGWVLSRDRRVRDPGVYDAARAIFRRNGYDPAALERTYQR